MCDPRSLSAEVVGNAMSQTWADRNRILVVTRARQRLKNWGVSASFLAEDGEGQEHHPVLGASSDTFSACFLCLNLDELRSNPANTRSPLSRLAVSTCWRFLFRAQVTCRGFSENLTKMAMESLVWMNFATLAGQMC